MAVVNIDFWYITDGEGTFVRVVDLRAVVVLRDRQQIYFERRYGLLPVRVSYTSFELENAIARVTQTMLSPIRIGSQG